MTSILTSMASLLSTLHLWPCHYLSQAPACVLVFLLYLSYHTIAAVSTDGNAGCLHSLVLRISFYTPIQERICVTSHTACRSIMLPRKQTTYLLFLKVCHFQLGLVQQSNLNYCRLKEKGRIFREAFLAKLGLLLRGTVAAPPERYGETLADEHIRGGNISVTRMPARCTQLAQTLFCFAPNLQMCHRVATFCAHSICPAYISMACNVGHPDSAEVSKFAQSQYQQLMNTTKV